MTVKLQGFHRKLYQTRYARKSKNKVADIKVGSTVITLVKDGKYPIRESAIVDAIHGEQIELTLTSGEDTGKKFKQKIQLIDVLTETEYEETAKRVAMAIASVEPTAEGYEKAYKQFKQVIEDFDFIPSGRILSGAGDDAEVTLFNCYVTNILPAPFARQAGADSRQAIFFHEQRIAEIMAHGGGNGSCLSVLRPRFTGLSTTKGQSAGSVFTGNRFSSLTEWVNQGNRRGAQMLTIHDWHPDLFYTADISHDDYSQDFIGAKTKAGFMEGNNSSILISDAFMTAVENNSDWDLVFPDTTHPKYDELWNGDLIKWKDELGLPVVVHATVKAKDIWDKLIKCNWLSAEPGILFIDKINQMHNLSYLGRVMATNPCGEQPLLDKSTCNLGAVNWGRMIKKVGHDKHGNVYEVDFDKFKKTVRIGVRFLDNVIDATHYWDEELKEWQQGERRVGLGLLGLADLLIALRIPYGSKESITLVGELMRLQRDIAYDESVNLSIEKGAFPFFDKVKYMESGFIKTLSKKLQERISEFGIRNGTLLTIAPTGTTGSITPSLLDEAGSVSTGCEPHFAMKYERLSRIGTTIQYAGVAQSYMNEHPDSVLPDYFVGAMDLSPKEHVEMQAILQKYVDTSISKTVNCPSSYTEEQVAEVYQLAHKMGLKGCTIYRDGSRDEQILSTINNIEVENEAPSVEEFKKEWEKVINESSKVVVIEPVKKKGKYDDWSCGNCGHTEFNMVENCPQCKSCGTQACSIG